MTRLTQLALRQPAITILLVLFLLVAGSVAATRLNQELVPQVEFPQATVVTLWPGASASEVTNSIVEPIEDALEEITDVEIVEVSASASESFSAVTVRAEYGTTQDELREAIQSELDDVDLPEDAEDPDVVLFSFSDLPVVQASVRAAGDDLDLAALQELIEDEVISEIESIEGVSQVSLAGGREEKIFLDLDPDALDARGVSAGSIRNALSSNDLSFPAGTLEVDGRSVPLRATYRIRSEQDLGRLSLSGGNGDGGNGGGRGGPPPGAGGDPSASAESSSGADDDGSDDADDENERSSNANDDESNNGADEPRFVAIPLPDSVTRLNPGFETTEDLTPDALRRLERLQPGTLRDLADEVIAQVEPGGPSPVTEDVLAALPEDVQDELREKLEAEPEGADAEAEPDEAEAIAAAESNARIVLVDRGDDLAEIAEREGVSLAALRAANGIDADVDEAQEEILRVPVEAVEGSALPSSWDAFGVDDASQVSPAILAAVGDESPDLVAALTDEQILALPSRSVDTLPRPFLERRSPDLRAALIRRGALRADDVQRPVLLKDVARIVSEPEAAETINRTDGTDSLSFLVFKDQGANTVSVVNEVLDRLEEIEDGEDDDIDADLEFNVIFEQASFIEESLQGVRNEGILGGLFAVLVILAFLAFSIRSTIVAAISIPLSLLTALLIMNLQGLTLNLLTLAGLTIAIGRVVDDTIVVLENIYRHIQQGEPIREAVITGTREVATAITASTLVAVAVFLPLGYVGGITSQFFLPLALTTSYALLASLIVAVTIVPLLARRLLRRDLLPEERETWIQRAYTPSLEWALDHKFATLALAGLFFLLSLGLVRFIDQTFLPGFGEPAITVEVALPPGTDLESTDAVVQEVEAYLSDLDDIASVEATVGRGGTGFFGEFAGGDSAQAVIFSAIGDTEEEAEDKTALEKAFEEKVDVVVLAEDIRDDLEELADELVEMDLIDQASDVTFTVSGGASGGPNGSLYDLQIRSEDEEALAEANAMVLEALEELENWEDLGFNEVPIINLKSNLSEARDIISVEVDPVLASQRSLSTIQVGVALRQVIEGLEVGDVEIEDGDALETYEVVARWPEDTISSVRSLRNFEIDAPGGEKVRLGDIATIDEAPGPVLITRIDGDRAAILSGEISDTDTFGVQDAAVKIIEDLDFEDEFGEDVIEVGAGVESSQQREGFNDLLFALPISILIVYLIMVVTFGSLVHPFTILFSLPFAMSGALVALAITGRAIGLSSLIGMMMLIGIVTTNAIVLVDLVQQYRDRGMDARTALIKGGRNRIRPILMTALATIFALIPQAIGLTEGALIASELATTVIGGLLTSTFLTLLVVPVIYSILDPLTGRDPGSPHVDPDNDGPDSGGSGMGDPRPDDPIEPFADEPIVERLPEQAAAGMMQPRSVVGDPAPETPQPGDAPLEPKSRLGKLGEKLPNRKKGGSEPKA